MTGYAPVPGDPEARRLWKLFRQASLEEFERAYAVLGIRFDDVRGESFYEDLMGPVLDELAHRIGVGAVIFNDLKNRRARDVVFDWDEVLSFEGETGPYLQYTAARIASMGEKYGRAPTADVDFALLDHADELALVLALAGLPDSLERGVRACEPSLVADRLLEIASRFSALYSNKSWKVLSDDEPLSAARMLLAWCVRQTLCNGLAWLGIRVPDRM